jgi:hypothetical protein
MMAEEHNVGAFVENTIIENHQADIRVYCLDISYLPQRLETIRMVAMLRRASSLSERDEARKRIAYSKTLTQY